MRQIDTAGRHFRLSGALTLLIIILPGLGSGCRHAPLATGPFNPQEYTPVSIEQLQAPQKAGLLPGQKVSVAGYFWQYLEYDPYPVPQYLALIRRPLLESRWRWASLYASPQLQGYCDRLALSRELRHESDLKRLEHVQIYGRLAHLPFGILYLQAEHIDRLDAEGGPPTRTPKPPAVEGRRTPAS